MFKKHPAALFLFPILIWKSRCKMTGRELQWVSSDHSKGMERFSAQSANIADNHIADNVCFLFSRMGTEECAEEQRMLLLSFPILMLSPASTSEILMGKSFLTAVLNAGCRSRFYCFIWSAEINWLVLIILVVINMIMIISIENRSVILSLPISQRLELRLVLCKIKWGAACLYWRKVKLMITVTRKFRTFLNFQTTITMMFTSASISYRIIDNDMDIFIR